MNANQKRRTAVLISGRGSNLQALVHASLHPDYPAAIALVASNRKDAAGLAFARDNSIAATTICAADHDNDPEQFDNALNQLLTEHDIELVCLAGFMRILGPTMVSRWPGRMLNIHPSLLPAYPGLNTHARVLADGATVTGCTVHFVTAELDAGPPIMQSVVSTGGVPSAGELADRVLEQEHRIYPRALAAVAAGHAVMRDGRTEWRANASRLSPAG